MLHRSGPIGVQAEKLLRAGGLKIPYASSPVETCIVLAFVVQEIFLKSGIHAHDSPLRKSLRRFNRSLRRKPASHIQHDGPWLEVRPFIRAQISIDFPVPSRKREG